MKVTPMTAQKDERRKAFVCALSVFVILQYDVWYSHCLHSSSGHFMKLSPSCRTFRSLQEKRRGTTKRGGAKTAFVRRKATSHCCLLGGVIFPDRVQRPGLSYFFEDAEAVSQSFPKLYRLPLLLCNYVSLLTSHLSVGFFNPGNELLVFTLRLQMYQSAGNCHDGQLAFDFSIG